MRICLLLILLYLVSPGDGRGPGQHVSREDIDKVRLDRKGFEKTQMIHYNWYIHSIKALMGQLGKDLMKELHTEHRRSFYKCLDRIADKRDIVRAAQCLMDAKQNHEDHKRTYTPKPSSLKRKTLNMKKQLTQKYMMTHKSYKTSFEPLKIKPYKKYKKGAMGGDLYTAKKTFNQAWKMQKFRRLSKVSHSLRGRRTFSMKRHLAKMFQKRQMMLNYNGKMDYSTKSEKKDRDAWFVASRRETKRRFRRSPYRLITDMVSKSDSYKYKVINMEKAPALKPVGRSPARRVTNLIKTFIHGKNATEKQLNGKLWAESYKNILEMKKAMDKRASEPGAKVYEMRMLDLVLNRKNPTKGKHEKSILPPLVEDAMNLLKTIDKSPKSVGDSSNFKFLSPRFASVMPDKSGVRGKLSPSILSFYKDDSEDQILPIPKLLEATGLKDEDRESVLETIMELSGARQTVDDAMKVLKGMNLFGMEGELGDVTKRIAENFQNLEKSFNSNQQLDMQRRGFTFMETNQIQELYDKQGMKHPDEAGLNMAEYGNLTKQQREESLWLRIHEIAKNGSESSARSKRQITWLSVLNPVVLDPYMFAPVYGFSVLGPTVLSPSLFSPLILNPAVLSPYVLSPAVGMPFILSPYVLSPYVISPLVMAPFILTPYVLSPNVINPYVLSPLILSPLVLCPDVISPMVLGGAILSPGVASPSVLSKSYLMASVLSPAVLS